MIELMVALLVASIILSAVATLASATTAADRATDQMGRDQSQLRMVSMRLTDLIRRANGVTISAVNGFQLWHDTNADGLETSDERTTIIRGSDLNTLTIGSKESYDKCQDITFAYDAASPDTGFITVGFKITENGRLQEHTINARLWVSDGYKEWKSYAVASE